MRGNIKAALGVVALISVSYGFVPSAFVSKSVLKATNAEKTRRFAMQSDSLEGGKILVSGFCNAKERTDQFVFDVLHAQSRWNKIVAFSPSNSFAKKRLISRTSRYSGLNDVLEFQEGDFYDEAVMAEKLNGCDAWLCFDCDSDRIKPLIDVAKTAGVKTIVLTSSAPVSEAQSSGILSTLESSGLRYSFLRTGSILDGKESGIITVRECSEELPMEQVMREDVARVAAECFRIDAASNKSFAVGKGDDVTSEYLKSLRQKGTDRVSELTALIGGGLAEYLEQKRKASGVETEEEKAARLVKEAEEKKIALEESDKRDKENREKTYQRRIETETDNILRHEFTTLSWIAKRGIEEEDYMTNQENRENVKARAIRRVEAWRSGNYDYDSDDEKRESQFSEPQDDEDGEIGDQQGQEDELQDSVRAVPEESEE